MRAMFKNDNVELRKEMYKRLFSQIYVTDVKDNVEKFYTLFKDKINKCNEIYNIDLSKISDDDFGSFLNSNYEIDMDINEYIDIYNEANNKNYCLCEKLMTNICSEVPMFTSNEGIHSSWILMKVRIGYKVLLNKDSLVDINKEHSLNAIKEMIEKKDIVILETIYEDINAKNKEDIKLVEPPMFKSFPFEECKKEGNDYFKVYIKKIRFIVDNKRKLKDLSEYLLDLKKEMDYFFEEKPYINIQNEIIKVTLEKINGLCEYDELVKKIIK